MFSHHDPMRRTAREWTIRLILAAATAVLGYYGVTFSFAQVVGHRDPALAYRLAPYDGRVTARYAASLADKAASSFDRAYADRLAKRALREEPTAVAAVATLGINAAVRGKKNAARQYFSYAQKLSRRDLRTQLWMIEDAVGRGDVEAALDHYDITLRVFPTMNELLYPILGSAIDNPAIRSGLIRTLGRKPSWGENFINYVAAQGPHPQSTAALLAGLRRAGVFVPEGAHARMVNALIAAQQLEAAWSYYSTVRPGLDRRRSRDPRFAAPVQPPSQFDWMPVGDGGLTTSIDGGIFDFTAPASVGGPMLQQVQLLPPGDYRLYGHSIGIDQAGTSRPYWTLKCADGRELQRIDVPNSTVANGLFSGTIRVPAGCAMQTLLLIARPSSAVSGLSGQFDRVELTPANQGTR